MKKFMFYPTNHQLNFSSFSICDALICIPENSNKILKNQKVDCILLPN